MEDQPVVGIGEARGETRVGEVLGVMVGVRPYMFGSRGGWGGVVLGRDVQGSRVERREVHEYGWCRLGVRFIQLEQADRAAVVGRFGECGIPIGEYLL